MARTSATITVGADTRQLERDIQSALNRDFKFKGINEKAFTQPLGRITGAANEFQKSLDASNARVIAFGASAGLIYTVERAFTDLIRSTVEVQKSLTDINVILNTTTQGLAKFGGEVFNIAKNTGQSFQAVAQAATEFARQGLGVEETLKRTRDALVLTRLSGLDVVSSVEALTATVNSFNKVALDSTTVINKLANVDAAFAVSSADLANAISRVGSSAQDAGVSFDELLGIVTSVQQTTARGGAVIGNSLKTIFTRIQRTDVLDQLQALGLNVRDLEGNTLPALQILQELAGTFDQLADSQRAQVAESVGGVFQINVLKAALGDLGKEYSIYERALKTSTSSTDEAIKRNEALNETVAALFNRTVANVTQLSAAFGAGAFQPAIESTLKNINKVLEFISNQDSESIGGKLGEGILKGLSTFISGPGIVLITAVLGKLTLDLAKFASSGFRTLLGINQQAEARAQLQAKINQVLSQEPQLLAAINAKQVSVLSVENQILKILREQNALRTQAAALSSTIGASLVTRGVGVKGGQITTKSSGFIPNYSLSEVYGALSGGYKPGKIKEMNISGEGRVIYNSAEKVKKFPGMSQPAIIPPKNSKAGKQYQKDFTNENGFDPYASNGFIPNFAPITFNPKTHINQGGTLGRSNKSTAEGLSRLIQFMGIPYSGPITKDGLSKLFASKENKLKLYKFLKKDPILVKRYPELYSEVKDGNHRFELAQLAGIKNIPTQYLSKGFIPNFAANPFQQAQRYITEASRSKIDVEELIKKRGYNISPEVRKELDSIKASPALLKKNGPKEIVPFKAQSLGIVGVNGRRGAINAQTSFNTLGYQNDPRIIRFEGIQARTLEDLKNSTINSKGAFSTEINKLFVDPLANLANSIFGPISPDPKFKSTLASNTRKPGINLFPPGAEGSIFEAAVNLGTKKGGALEQAFNQDASQKPFDFEESSPPATSFNSKFGFTPPVIKADAKRTINSEQAREIIDKAYRDATTRPLLPIPRLKNSGFVPNFSALDAAIERELAAGVPSSKIRIGQDNRLTSSYNPLGVGVYNTEDEPNGIKQGIAAQKNINVAKKAGSFSEGFIPNFAPPFIQVNPAMVASMAGGGMSSQQAALQYQKTFAVDAQREFRGIVDELRNQRISLKTANKQVNDLVLKYNLTNQSATNMNRSLQGVANATRSFNQNVSNLERSAGGFLGLGIGGGRQLRELERIRDTTTGERAQRASEALGRAQQARQASGARLQTAGIGLSIAAPILAQTIAASRPEDKNAQAAAEGLGTFASFAGAGALFGPLGIAIGGTIGALVGFKKALDIVNSRSAEFARQAQESQNNLARFSEDVQTFLNTRTQVEGLRSGEIKGTQAELSRVEKTQRAALSRIFNSAGPEITSQIKYALESGNEELLRESLGRATIAKESANSIDQFTDKIIQLKEKGDLAKTFNENIIAFGNLRTRSGETFAELFSKNESLIESLNGYANAVELVSLTTSKGIQDLEQNVQDPLSFVNLSPFENGPRSVLETGRLPFSEEQIAKKIRDLENAYAESVDGLTSQLTSTIPADFLTRTQESKKAFALQSLATDLANESLKGFNQEVDSFVTNLVDAKKITEKNGSDIKLTFKTILEGPGDPKEKIQKIIEEFKVLGEQGELAAQVLENISKGLFTFSKLSGNLRQLFAQGGETEESQGKAAEQRFLAAETLKRANFADLLKDPEIFREFLPESVLNNLIKSTGARISGGTQDQQKREELFTQFGEEFKLELTDLQKGLGLTDEQFAKLRAGAERVGEKATLSSDNLFLLNKNISDATLRQEAVNEYKRIEADLTKKLNGNIDLLVPAAKNAAEELALIQKARLGQLFLEEKNQRLMQGAYGKIKTPGLFEGLDIEEMTARSTADYEKLIADLTNEGITSINTNIFDEQAKILAKERLKALEKEQLSLVKTQGGLSTRQLSDAQARFRQLNASNTSLKEGFDTLNESITNANLREEAKNILEEKSRSLEIEYQGNLVKLKEATSAFIEVLTKRAQFLEGRVFADELKGAEERARTEKIREGKFEGTDVFDAFSDEMIYGPQDAMKDLNALGTDTARTLKSEFNNAFQSIIDGTQEAGDAFRTMALNISRRIQQLALEMTTNLAFNSLFSSFGGIPSMFKNPLSGSTGGLVYSNKIKGYSYGGKVTGGSGVRDDVPAMLSRGEYVIRKSAVNKYGDGFLNRLNNGGVVKRERGGMGAGDPKDYTRFQPVENYRNVGMIAPQGVGATPDFSSRDAMGGAFSADLLSDFYYDQFEYGVPVGGKFVFDPRLSAFGRYDESNPANQLTIAKLERALTLQGEVESYKQYLADLDQRNREEQARINQINQEQQDAYNKQKRNAFWGSLLQAGAAIGFGAFSQYGVPALKAAFQGGSQGWANWRGTAPSSYNPSAYGYSNFRTTPPTLRKGYAKGGSIYKDDIPALLMDGEYVIRKDAVNLYGKDFFDKLNSGRINKYADGGMVSNGYSNSENFANSERESTQASNNTNNITITVNVNQANGTTTESKNQNQSSDNKTPDEKRQEEIERNKLLSERIKSEVVKVINQEQRPGGLLSSTKYKMNT